MFAVHVLLVLVAAAALLQPSATQAHRSDGAAVTERRLIARQKLAILTSMLRQQQQQQQQQRSMSNRLSASAASANEVDSNGYADLQELFGPSTTMQEGYQPNQRDVAAGAQMSESNVDAADATVDFDDRQSYPVEMKSNDVDDDGDRSRYTQLEAFGSMAKRTLLNSGGRSCEETTKTIQNDEAEPQYNTKICDPTKCKGNFECRSFNYTRHQYQCSADGLVSKNPFEVTLACVCVLKNSW